MISIDPAILIVMGEAILLLIVAMVGTVVFLFKCKKRDHEAATELQERLKGNATKRQEWYETVLANNIENGDEQANRALATSWVDKENQFYAHLVEMYMKRNSSALRGLDKLLHEYTSSYLDLVSLMRTRFDEEQQGKADDVKVQLERLGQEGERLSESIKALEQENSRLNKELEQANKEIDQTMREYVMAFRPGGGMTGSAIVAEPEAKAVAPAVDGASASDEGAATPIAESLAEGEAQLAEGDQMPASELEEVAVSASADWQAGFDESPDEEVPAESGAVIDLAGEGEILLPELHEIVGGDEVQQPAISEPLPDDQLPVLDQRVASSAIDEENLLAQLEGLEEIELPPFDSSTEGIAGPEAGGKPAAKT